MSGLICFDRGPLPGGSEFRAPQTIIRADTVAGVGPALAAMESARARGLWLAGYMSYELGFALSAKLTPLMPRS